MIQSQFHASLDNTSELKFNPKSIKSEIWVETK